MVKILGISGLVHDPAAALAVDGVVSAAMEEAKLRRLRSLDGIPRQAIAFCQEQTQTSWREVECVAVASQPLRSWLRQAWLRTRLTPLAPVPSGYYQTKALGELGRELNNDRILREMGAAPGCRVVTREHHLCHAASAFYASPAERAVVLTLDEQGDGWAGLVALGEGTKLKKLEAIPYPHSLGWVFSQVTDLLGYEPRRSEHKTQWLSLEGEPVFEELFVKMLRRGGSPVPRLGMKYFNRGLAGRIAFSKEFYQAIGVKPPVGRGEAQQEAREVVGDERLKKNLAASVQAACGRVAAELAESYRKKTGAKWLCLAGGVFLNPLMVAALEKNTGYEQVFVQPAAGNEGTALGAAWLVWHEQPGRPRVSPMEHLYLGPSYSNQEIKQVLDNCKADYQWLEGDQPKIEETVRLVEAGKIVAWCQGAAEFGPRALGNRSLLASPWAAYVKENLNEYVKHREAFRPFAIAVTKEESGRYFESTTNARFMATVATVKPQGRALLEGFLLPGDRVRLHVVERAANPLLWQLLWKFGERARAAMLVNTSFNLFGEPLVLTPRDAVRSFFCSGIDALVIGSFLLRKG